MEQTFVQDGATATAENGKGKGSRPPPLLPSAVTGGAGGREGGGCCVDQRVPS